MDENKYSSCVESAEIKELSIKNIDILQKSGIAYMSGRDSKYRPIIVIDVKKMVDLGIEG
jgi:hypothetical protein